jgi:hypothetical protein
MTTLPRTARFPLQHIYKCFACKFTAALDVSEDP